MWQVAMTVWEEMSDDSKDLLFISLNHALNNAETSEEGFIPFALRGTGAGRGELTRFVAGDLPVGIEAGRKMLATVPEGTLAVTLAWDGYVTYEDRRTEAVFVEVHESGLPKSLVVVQRYLRADGKVQRLGDPFQYGETDPLVRSVGVQES